jgi:hypothetical protein
VVVSDPGLEELLSSLGFALAAPLEGAQVSLYFQGLAVRALAKVSQKGCPGPPGRPVAVSACLSPASQAENREVEWLPYDVKALRYHARNTRWRSALRA